MDRLEGFYQFNEVLSFRTKSFAAHAHRESFDSTLSANQNQGGVRNDIPDHVVEAPAASEERLGRNNPVIRLAGNNAEEKDQFDGAKSRYIPPLATGRSASMPSYQASGAAGAAPDGDGDVMHGGYAARAVIAPGIYYFGIVDILQTWSMEKIAEK